MQIDYIQGKKYQLKCVAVTFALLEILMFGISICLWKKQESLAIIFFALLFPIFMILLFSVYIGFFSRIKFEREGIYIERTFWGLTYRKRTVFYKDIEYFYELTKVQDVTNHYFIFKLKRFPYSLKILLQSSFSHKHGRFISSKGKLKLFLLGQGVKCLSKKEREDLWV